MSVNEEQYTCYRTTTLRGQTQALNTGRQPEKEELEVRTGALSQNPKRKVRDTN